MNRYVAGALTGLALLFNTVTPASALTVTQYDSLPQETQWRAVQMIYDGNTRALVSGGAPNARLSCITDLFTPKDDTISDGIKRFSEELARARQSDPNASVERIMQGVMDQHCSPTDFAANPGAPAPNG